VVLSCLAVVDGALTAEISQLFHVANNARHGSSFSFAKIIGEQRLIAEQYLLIVGSFHASLQARWDYRSLSTFFLDGCPM
jgi:hypothetical protein